MRWILARGGAGGISELRTQVYGRLGDDLVTFASVRSASAWGLPAR